MLNFKLVLKKLKQLPFKKKSFPMHHVSSPKLGVLKSRFRPALKMALMGKGCSKNTKTSLLRMNLFPFFIF